MGRKLTIGMPMPVGPFIGTLHNALGKRLPLNGQRPIVPVVGSKVAFTPLSTQVGLACFRLLQ